MGPIFAREVLRVPRQPRHFLLRAAYVAALILLTYTARQATVGFQGAATAGDLARFGSLVFQLLSFVQLCLAIFFATLLTAGNIAQEKDRRTLVLLLMTDLRDRELVLGKLFASVLQVGILLIAAVPAFALIQLLGGVSIAQIGWSLAITASAALAAGSWGALVAFWREKTFQTLSISALGLLLFIGGAEFVVRWQGTESLVGHWATAINPFRALLHVLNPLAYSGSGVQGVETVAALTGLAAILAGVAIVRLRVWNPSRFIAASAMMEDEESDAKVATRATRNIWTNPVIWREVRTRAYGRRILVIKLAYLGLAAAVAYFAVERSIQTDLVLGLASPAEVAISGLALISLILVNAQAVTSLTGERDGRTLEFLLMTDVTAKEFIFGKLGGVLFNTKELLVVPILLSLYEVSVGRMSVENCTYVLAAFVTLTGFSAMLGLHSGLSFDSSRAAILNSLATLFFLFVGIFIFMILLVEARSSFFLQLQSFLIFIVVGSIALRWSLTHKNPSMALTISASILPFLTFYAITQFLLQGSLGVCFAILVAYGFTTLSMLVPAVSEFDVALGRTTLDQG